MATFLDGLCRSAAKRSIINLDPLRRQTEAAMPTAGDNSLASAETVHLWLATKHCVGTVHDPRATITDTSVDLVIGIAKNLRLQSSASFAKLRLNWQVAAVNLLFCWPAWSEPGIQAGIRQLSRFLKKIGYISILNPRHLNRLTFWTVLREFEPKKATILLFTGKILLWSRRSCRDSRRGMLFLSCLA